MSSSRYDPARNPAPHPSPNPAMHATESAAWSRVRFITDEIGLMLSLLTVGGTLRPGVATPELIAVLLGYLKEVASLRASCALEAISLDARVWQEYRTTLARLRSVLPNLERQLQDDRTRLARERDQLSRASNWFSTAKLTR